MKMTTVADSNVVISALLEWHHFNSRALPAIEKALAEDDLLLPQHVLMESYSVMTRFPLPRRVAPAVAYDLLHDTFGSCRVIAMNVGNTWRFLGERDIQTAGGRVYDAAIAVAAIEAGAQRLLTFNPKHFQPFAGQIEIVVPG
jgi:predicted nucleic acid-binding protein